MFYVSFNFWNFNVMDVLIFLVKEWFYCEDVDFFKSEFLRVFYEN